MIGSPIKLINYLSTQDSNKVFEIKEYKEHRSLSQNAYAWTLITQLGNALHKSKEDVYISLLKDYGQSVLWLLDGKKYEVARKYCIQNQILPF